MSYTTGGLQEVVVKKAGDLNALADLGGWAPAFHPYYIRAVMVIVANDIGGAGVVKFDKRPTFGSDTSRGNGDVATVNLATTHTGGTVVYVDGLNIKVSPGEEVVAEVTDVTAASDTADIVMLVEPAMEMPANITAMVEST